MEVEPLDRSMPVAIFRNAVLGVLVVLTLISVTWALLLSASIFSAGSLMWMIFVVPLVLGYLLAFGAFGKMKRSNTKQSRRVWSAVAVVLVLISSAPTLSAAVQVLQG